VTLVLDAGALLAIERGDRELTARIKRQYQLGRPPRTHGGVVGQVWRGGTGRQALLARALAAVEIVPLDNELGRRAGVLMGRAGTSDVVDAAVVLLAVEDDMIVTSDPGDLVHLAAVSETYLEIVSVQRTSSTG
jgi:predicted nucleic acid-binding protein